MSKLEVGRWSDLLRRMTGQKGSSLVASELAAEISPTFELEGPTAEWAFLKGVRLAAASTRVTAGVGDSRWRLRNPANSGCIAVVGPIVFSLGAAGRYRIRMGIETTDVGGVLTTAVRDTRWNAEGVQRNALVFSSANAAGAVGGNATLLDAFVLSLTSFTYTPTFVLNPGDSVDGGSVSSAVEVLVGLAWTERGLPALEQGT